MRALVLVLAFALALAPRALAQPAVEIVITSFGDASVPLPARRGAWLPLEVAIRNPGPAVETVLRCRRAGTGAGPASPVLYERRVNLAAASERREEALFFVRDTAGEVEIALLRADAFGGAPLARATARYADDERSIVALAVSRDASAYRLIARSAAGGIVRREVRPRLLRPEDLPSSPEGLELASAIFFANADARALTPAQADALRGYVEAGGQLVLVFSGNPREYDGPELEPLLPCDVEGAEPLAAGRLASFDLSGAGREGDPPLVARVRPREGATVLVRDGPRPLAVRRRVGAGTVTYLATDPARRRAGELAATLGGWLIAAPEPRPRDPFGAPQGGLDPVLDELAARAAEGETVRPPPLLVVAAVLVAYAIAAVPANYLFWRRRGKLERTAPAAIALALLFGAGMYGLGVAYKGVTAFATEATLVETASGERAGRATAAAGFFALARRLARIEARLATAPAPGSARARSGGEETGGAALVRLDSPGGPARILETVELDQWALRLFAAGGPAAAPAVRARFELAREECTGTIETPPGAGLAGAILFLGGRALAIGDVPAGTRRDVRGRPGEGLAVELARLPAEGAPAFARAEELIAALAERRGRAAAGERELEALLLARAPPPGEPWLAIDFPAPRRRPEAVLALAVPVALAPGPVDLWPGLVRPRAIGAGAGVRFTAASARRGRRDGDRPTHELGKGELTLEWTLPFRERFDPEVLHLDLRLPEGSPAVPPAIEVSLAGPGGALPITEDLAGGKGTLTRDDLGRRIYDRATGAIRLVIRNPSDSEPLVFGEPTLRVIGALK